MKTLRIISRFFLLAILTFLTASAWQYWSWRVALPAPIWLALARASALYYGQSVPSVPAGLPSMAAWLSVVRSAAYFGALDALAVVVVVAWLSLVIWFFRGRLRASKDQRALAAKTKEHAHQQIRIAGVPLPHKSEVRDVLLRGVPGAGKTQIVLSLLRQFCERGATIIAVDRDGELMQRLYRPGDSILNPLDQRTVKVAVQREARTEIERDSIAEMLFPAGGGSEAGIFFARAAATVFSVLLRVAGDRPLWPLLSSREALRAALGGTEADEYVRSREWGSIYTTLMNSTRWIRMLPPAGARDAFSIREFVPAALQKPGGAALWIPIPKPAAAALNPLAALAVGIVCEATLALPPNAERRVIISTDELGNLPALSKLETFCSEGRKHGGGMIAGVQANSQTVKIYGRESAGTIISCFQTHLIFRQGDEETAESASKFLGSREIREWHQSHGESAGGEHSTHSSGQAEHIRVKRSVLARELQELPDLVGYLSIAPHPPARVRVPLVNLPQVTAPFVPCPEPPSSPSNSTPAPAPPAPEPSIIFRSLAEDSSGEAATKVVTGGSEKCEE